MHDILPFLPSPLPLWVHVVVVLVAIGVIGKAAQWVVESSARLAARLGVSELVIGLTVVSLGTSAPEFAVTLLAAFRDQGDISVGNIVGSNIFNLGFILGGCALVRAIPTGPALFKRDGSVLAVTTVVLLGLVAVDLTLGRVDGIVLSLCLLAYLGYLFRQRKVLPGQEAELQELLKGTEKGVSLPREGLVLAAGLAGIVAGSHVLVDSASAIARVFGVSEWLIGVTVVAAGTSAPEFATSLVAVIRRRYGISVGNLVGSNIFNLLGVLGVAGLARPVTVDPSARISLAALAGLVILVLVFMRSGWRFSRLEGGILFVVGLACWAFEILSRV